MPKTKLKPQDIKEQDLLTLKELHRVMGEGYSPSTIRRRIARNELNQGQHYFRVGNPANGIIKVDLMAIKQDLIDFNS
jgi:hypothetical protein